MSNQKRYTRAAARRRNRRQLYAALALIACVAVLFIAAKLMLRSDHRQRTVQPEGSLAYVATNPSLDEQVVNYKGFTVSFNKKTHTPNWAAWELTADEAQGKIGRSNNFRADTSVKGCPDPKDYTNSGYDRGHMAPAADMAWDATAMGESFLLTNIVPQDRRLNSNTWRRLEEKCRARAKRDSVVVIVCGPVPGDTPLGRIGKTGVEVPRRLFKVVLSPYANPPRAIGFVFDNSAGAKGMEQSAMSVDAVEALTGHDFFSALPDDIEATLESSYNFNAWSRMK